jgi:hypothetical protein
MITSSFYNDNLFRSYPFVARDTGAAWNTLEKVYKAVVGAKVMVYSESLFINNFPRAFLQHWITLTDTYQLTFLVTDKSDVTVRKIITIPKTTLPFTKISSNDNDGVVVSIIVGELSAITFNWFDLDLQLEPTCLLWYRHRGISKIYVVNQERHRLRLETSVIDADYRNLYGKVAWWLQPEEGLESIENGSPCLFNGGFNCEINQSSLEQKLQFIPQSNAGLGEATEDIALGYTTVSTTELIDDVPTTVTTLVVERSPAFNLRKDGLPTAENVVYHVSSAAGPEIILVSDTAVSVRPEINISTIFIGVAMLFGESC